MSLPDLKGMRALVVDDNSTNRLVLKELLSSWEMDSEEVESGPQALEKIRIANTAKRPFDIIICDYHMPEMNGLELGRRLSTINLGQQSPATVVMLTSEDRREEFSNFREMGISSFVMKPIRRADLLKTVKRALGENSTPPSILVVEDHNDLREQLSSVIAQTLNVRTLTATNGNEALQLIRSENISVVVTDHHLPEMNGTNLLTECRNAGSEIPFVFISGYAQSLRSRFNSDTKGILGILDKPFDHSELVDLLKTHLNVRDANSRKENRSGLNPYTSKNPLKILIVDDVPENADLIQAYLKNGPYSVDFASGGVEALTKFFESKYDLIFMDVQMPLMDGNEVVRRIRKIEKEEQRPRTTIVTLSAHAVIEEIKNSEAAGTDGYLTKPIKKSHLLDAIDRYSRRVDKAA